ncbi:MAG: nucleotidyltransferase domain-containing protein [Planctomycetota bacterium]
MMRALSRNEVIESAREALATRPRVLLAYLFGSCARGTEGPLSDVDVAVLLSNRSGDDDELGEVTDQLERRLGMGHVDVVPLDRAPIPLRYRVVRDGLVLVCRDQVARERLEVDAMRRYLDFKCLRDRAFLTLRNAILAGG